MITSLARQGGRRYGQMHSTSSGWIASLFARLGAVVAFNPAWAASANKSIGLMIEPQ